VPRKIYFKHNKNLAALKIILPHQTLNPATRLLPGAETDSSNKVVLGVMTTLQKNTKLNFKRNLKG